MSDRKTTLALAVVVTATASLASSPAWADEVGDFISATVVVGDTNADGRVDEDDAKAIENLLLGRCARTVSLRTIDIDRNGRFDGNDLTTLRDALRDAPNNAWTAEEEEVRVIVGDANDDGRVDARDLMALASFALLGRLFEAPLVAADVDGNGAVDFDDLAFLARALQGSAPSS